MKCGRDATRDCPAVKKDAGYMCWVVAGTMCGGEAQGSYVEKVGNCRKCSYYQYVHQLQLE